MNINNNDILYNTLLKQRYLNNIENDNENKKENENNENKNNLINIIDISLRKYLEFFLFEYKGANINLLKEKINVENNIIKKLSSIVNNNLYSLENDYFNDNGNNNNDILSSENVIIIDDSFSLKGKKLNNKEKINIILLKGELYKGILIKKEDKDTLVKIINDTFNVNISDEINDLLYNNILIYLENRLVCRLGQNKFGDLPYFIKKQKKKEWYYNYMGYIELPSNGLYELNLLKSEFKDNSMISLFFSKINNLIKKLNKK
jgi:hypothetical protein